MTSRNPMFLWTIKKIHTGPDAGKWRMRLSIEQRTLVHEDSPTWEGAFKALISWQRYYPHGLPNMGARYMRKGAVL